MNCDGRTKGDGDDTRGHTTMRLAYSHNNSMYKQNLGGGPEPEPTSPMLLIASVLFYALTTLGFFVRILVDMHAMEEVHIFFPRHDNLVVVDRTVFPIQPAVLCCMASAMYFVHTLGEMVLGRGKLAVYTQDVVDHVVFGVLCSVLAGLYEFYIMSSMLSMYACVAVLWGVQVDVGTLGAIEAAPDALRKLSVAQKVLLSSFWWVYVFNIAINSTEFKPGEVGAQVSVLLAKGAYDAARTLIWHGEVHAMDAWMRLALRAVLLICVFVETI